nr:S1 RNA-binding domain-containing protein [Streptomyces hundungensis]
MERRGQTVPAGDATRPLPGVRRPHRGGPETARTGHQAGAVRRLRAGRRRHRGLVHLRELARTPADAPEDVVRLGDKTTVIVTEVDREQRRLVLSRRQATLDR